MPLVNRAQPALTLVQRAFVYARAPSFMHACALALARAFVFAALAACEASVGGPRMVRVIVRDDRGAVLAGVPVEVEGIAATSTASDGTARVSLAAEGAPRVRVGVSCPTQFRPVEPRHVARNRFSNASFVDLTFTCRPSERTLVVVARVPGGQGLALRADGEPIGRIAADGTLHALLSRAPDSELRLMLDTEERAVSPRNPARELRVADRDELIVFEEQLSVLRPRMVRAKTVTPKQAEATPLPYAIRARGEF